jgi:hypothetical protein
MRISRSTIEILIIGIAYLLLLGVAMFAPFGKDNRFYYQTIAYVLSGVLLFTYIYLLNRRNKPKTQ